MYSVNVGAAVAIRSA